MKHKIKLKIFILIENIFLRMETDLLFRLLQVLISDHKTFKNVTVKLSIYSITLKLIFSGRFVLIKFTLLIK